MVCNYAFFASIVQLHVAVFFSGRLSYFLCVLHIVDEGELAHLRCTFSKANRFFLLLQNEKVFAFYFVVFQCTDDGLFSTTQLINYVCRICNFFAVFLIWFLSLAIFFIFFELMQSAEHATCSLSDSVFSFQANTSTHTHKNQISLIESHPHMKYVSILYSSSHSHSHSFVHSHIKPHYRIKMWKIQLKSSNLTIEIVFDADKRQTFSFHLNFFLRTNKCGGRAHALL